MSILDRMDAEHRAVVEAIPTDFLDLSQLAKTRNLFNKTRREMRSGKVPKGMKIKEERIREEWEFDSLWESDEEKFDDLDEAQPKPAKSKPPSKGLSPSQRRRMALRMKIQAKKPSFIMKRLRSMKRAATKAKLYMRARKAAIQKVVAKFYPKLKTKSRSELSYAERGKISDIVKKKKSVIARFAKRMVKDKRKQDVERRRSMQKPKDK